MPPKYSIRDPLWDFVSISDWEAVLLESSGIQRLRRIHQMGFTSLVFPGAEHSCFSHAVGSAAMSSRIVENIDNQILRQIGEPESIKASVRKLALSADLETKPFNLNVKISKEATSAILEVYPFDDSVAEFGWQPSIEKIVKDIVLGPLGAKMIDTALRDSLFCGVKYGVFDVDRLLDTIIAIPDPRTGEWRLGIKEAGLHTLEAILAAHSYMFDQVYCNETVTSFEVHYASWLAEERDLVLSQEDDWTLAVKLRHSESEHAKILTRERGRRYICLAKGEAAWETGPQAALVEKVRELNGSIYIVKQSKYWELAPEEILVLTSSGHIRSLEECSPPARYMRQSNRFLIFGPREASQK